MQTYRFANNREPILKSRHEPAAEAARQNRCTDTTDSSTITTTSLCLSVVRSRLRGPSPPLESPRVGGGELTPGAPLPPLPLQSTPRPSPSSYRVRQVRGSTKTQTLCEQDTGATRAFFRFFGNFRTLGIFPAAEKWDFMCL